MYMSQTTETQLLASILELAERDYNHPISGYRIELYLDPENCIVYTFDCVGAGVPMLAWHRRHRWICTIPDRAIPESVAEVVTAHVGHLVALCERYLGTEWDGSNHVGRWAEPYEPSYFDCEPGLDFACYWDPGDWFSGDGTDTEIRELAAQGHTPADIMAELYLGDQYNGQVEPEAALEYVTELVAEHTGPLS